MGITGQTEPVRVSHRKKQCGQRCGHYVPRPQRMTGSPRTVRGDAHRRQADNPEPVRIVLTPQNVSGQRRRDNAPPHRGKGYRVCAARNCVVRFVSGPERRQRMRGPAIPAGQKGQRIGKIGNRSIPKRITMQHLTGARKPGPIIEDVTYSGQATDNLSTQAITIFP